MTDERAQRSGISWPQRCLDFLPEVFFLVSTTAIGFWAGGRWLNPFGDPGFSWSAVHRVAQGEAPYRDFFLSYTPLSVEALAAASRLFGEGARFWMLANWIPAVLVGLLLLVAARRILGPVQRVAVAVVFMALSLFVPGDGRLIYPYYPGGVHATLFALGALILIVRAGKAEKADQGETGAKSELRLSFIAGVLAGLAFCCKQEIGVAALAGILAAIVILPRRAPARVAAVAGGAILAVGATLCLVLPLPPLSSLVADSRLWPLALAPPAQLTPLFRFVAGITPGWERAVADSALELLLICALVHLAAMLAVWTWTRTRPRPWSVWIPLGALLLGIGAARWFVGPAPPIRSSAVCLTVLVALTVAIAGLFRRSLPERPFVLGLATFAALAGARTLFSPATTLAYAGPGRIAASLTWVYFLCVLLPGLLVPRGAARSLAGWLMTGALLFATIPPALEGIRSLRFDDRVAVDTRQGRVFVSPAQASILSLLSRSLDEGERALLVPESNVADVLFGVRDVSPLIDLMPGWVNDRTDRELAVRFERANPDVVVLFDRPTREYKVDPFGRGFGRKIAQWCDSRFQIVAEGPHVRVLRHLPPGSNAAASPCSSGF